MKIYLTKNRLHFAAKAFTLLELTVMALVGALIASMSLVLFNTQVTSFRMIRTQDFLIHEAPQINNTLNQVIPRANFFRLYNDPDDVTAGINPVIANANTLVLEFRNNSNAAQAALSNEPLQPSRFGVITIDPATNNLNYYNLADPTDFDITMPSWTISSQVTNVVFFIQQGVLRTTITGPNGSQITHSTTTQR